MRISQKLYTTVFATYSELTDEKRAEVFASELKEQHHIDHYGEMRYDDWKYALDYIDTQEDILAFDVHFNSGSSYLYISDITLEHLDTFIYDLGQKVAPLIDDIDYDVDYSYHDDKFEMTINSVTFTDIGYVEWSEECLELEHYHTIFVECIREHTLMHLNKLVDRINTQFYEYKEALLFGTDDHYEEWLQDYLFDNDEEFVMEQKVVDLNGV